MEPGEQAQGAGLHRLHIGEDGGRRAHGFAAALQPEAVQAGHAKVALQAGAGGLRLHLPCFHARHHRAQHLHQAVDARLRRLPAHGDQFAGLQAAEFFAKPLLHFGSGGAGQLRGGKFAGGNIAVGQPKHVPALPGHDGQQVVVAPFVEHPRFDHGALGDDAAHRALDQAIARLAHLLGNGDAIPRSHQLGDVAVDAVVGHAGQRHALVVAHRPDGEHYVTDARHDLGVVVEGFVEITQAKEQNTIRVLVFDRQILLSHRCRHARLDRSWLLKIRRCAQYSIAVRSMCYAMVSKTV